MSGRPHEAMPLVSWKTKSSLLMAAFGLWALLAWHLAVTATSAGVAVRDLGVSVRALVRGRPLGDLPGATPSTVWTVVVWVGLLVVSCAALLALVFWFYAWLDRRRTRRGFASGRAIREGIGVERARVSAAQTRPGLSARAREKAPLREVGLEVGTSVTGEPVVIPHEDHIVVIAITGQGKSRDLMIGAALDAPGALMVTCTRADILDVVATPRAERGRIWVFDPLERLGWPEPMVWNPVAGCQEGGTALARGLAFAAGLGTDDTSATNSGFFRQNAASVLTRLLHAAALEDRPIADVIDWAMRLDDGAEVPQDIIRTSPLPQAERMWAGMLRSLATGADETVASTRQTLQQAIEPMALRRVLKWVTPREGVPSFGPAAFVASTDTLVLVGDDNASTNVGPLCTMLVQEVVDAAKAVAVRLPGGRLDPPLRFVGDELANVAPLPKLPTLPTDARGFGLQLVAAFQSMAQVRRRWGKDSAAVLMDNMPAEILLGGLTDVEALNRYTVLVGEVEIQRMTGSFDAEGRATHLSERTSEGKAMRPDEARKIPDGHGLLLYRNRDAVLMRMRPWYQRADGKALTADAKTVEARRLAAGAATPTHG